MAPSTSWAKPSLLLLSGFAAGAATIGALWLALAEPANRPANRSMQSPTQPPDLDPPVIAPKSKQTERPLPKGAEAEREQLNTMDGQAAITLTELLEIAKRKLATTEPLEPNDAVAEDPKTPSPSSVEPTPATVEQPLLDKSAGAGKPTSLQNDTSATAHPDAGPTPSFDTPRRQSLPDRSSDAPVALGPQMQAQSSQLENRASNITLQIGPNVYLTSGAWHATHARKRIRRLSPSERRVALQYEPSSSAQSLGAFALVGTTAPRFDFKRWTEGDRPPPSTLSMTGKVIVIFAFQSTCGACLSHGLPVTRQLESTFAYRHDVEFIYVQTPFDGSENNDFAELRRTKQAFGIFRPMAQDHTGIDGLAKMAHLFRMSSTPWHVVIDKQGIVRFNDSSRSYDFYELVITALL